MTGDDVAEMEKLFRTVSDLPQGDEIVYNKGLGKYCRGAKIAGTASGDVNYNVLLSRAFTMQQVDSGKRQSEMIPAGNSISVDFSTSVPASDGWKSTVRTKINGRSYAHDLIMYALDIQTLASDYLKENSVGLSDMLETSLPITELGAKLNLEGETMSLLYDPVIESVRMFSRLQREARTGNIVELRFQRDSLPMVKSDIIPALDYQIERLKKME
jgi:hypothetical protein